MALKKYEVTIDGRHPHKTTLMLSEEDAKRMGVAEQKAAQPVANKARKPANKAAKPAANKTTETSTPVESE